MKDIIIIGSNSNLRIDKFLKKEIFFNEEITRGEIIRQIKSGNILVNNKKVKPSYMLKESDKIEVNSERKSGKLIPNKNLKFEIIYKDENIITINKPAGISVHPVKLDEENTLANGLIYKFPEIKNVGDDPKIRPGIVHRLDKDTSGIMVIARNQKVFEELKRKFKSREIEKKYSAIVHGELNKRKGIIEKSIARSSSYKKQVIAGKKTKTKVRPAVTGYKVVQEMKNYSLIELCPKTGRMHQIRVHMKSIGHPILGDEKYKSRNIKTSGEAKRQMLHAKSIGFELFGKKYYFLADLPEDFAYFLNS